MKTYIILILTIMMLGALPTLTMAMAANSAVPAFSLLNQNPDPASTGDTVNMRFQIQNLGPTSLTGLQLQIVQDYPFTIANGNDTVNVDTIGPYQAGDDYVNVLYTLKIDPGANSGVYPLKLNWRVGDGAWTTINFNVNINAKQYAQIIYLDKSKLEPGVETEMNFTITNVGGTLLQNLVFSWIDPSGKILPVYTDNSRYIKGLDIGQSVDISYTAVADINANPGLYPLNLKLKYETATNSNTSELDTNAGIVVGGTTDFDVTFSQSSGGQTSLSVANTGNNPAQSVTVTVPQQSGYTVSGANAAIVGNLNRGDYTLVTFAISSRGNTTGAGASGLPGSGATGGGRNFTGRGNFTGAGGGFLGNASNGQLQVQIAYTDTTGQRVTLIKYVNVNFRGGSSSFASGTGTAAGRSTGGTTVPLWIVIVLAVLLVISSYFAFKKRQKK